MGRFWREKETWGQNQAFFPTVSLIVPIRNEAENIPNLSLNLRKFRYPNLEILLIDDHSEDSSFQLLTERFEVSSNVQVLRSPGIGKKSALEHGVNTATGEIILCTDADCDFPEFWVERMVSPFRNPGIQLVAGAVLVEGKGKFSDVFQSLDWASVLLVTNYFFAQKEPLMCSGANLAYRKLAFERVDGYEGNRQFASGDDEFLLKKIHKRYGKEACCYLSSAETLVMTAPEPNWKALVNQRIRWASKWKAHFSISHVLAALGAFFVQLVWIGSVGLVSYGGKGILALAGGWSVKVVAEKLALGKVLGSLGKRPTGLVSLLASVVHPIYVLRVGIGALAGKFTWKGRSN